MTMSTEWFKTEGRGSDDVGESIVMAADAIARTLPRQDPRGVTAVCGSMLLDSDGDPRGLMLVVLDQAKALLLMAFMKKHGIINADPN